jgi:glycosyltransferase involved in cell wall biosynthesis
VTVVGSYVREGRVVEDDEGVRVIRLPVIPIRGVGLVQGGWRLRRELTAVHREAPIDVLEGPETSLGALPRTFPAVRIIRMHGGHHFFRHAAGMRPAAGRGWLERRSFERADELCAVSRFVAESTRGLLRLADRPITILPNPVDTETFRPNPEIREEPGLIVFVGTLCEKKGVRQLVEAMPEVARSAPHARLCLVGRDWVDRETGRRYTEMLGESIAEEVRDRIEFVGIVDNLSLPGLLARAEVLVYPSHMEAMPLTWLEGLSMGKPVVASRTGPGPEVVEDGVSGLLCNPHDPASIAEKITVLLADARLRLSLGRAARERVVGLFSVGALVERNEAFYRDSCGRRAESAP